MIKELRASGRKQLFPETANPAGITVPRSRQLLKKKGSKKSVVRAYTYTYIEGEEEEEEDTCGERDSEPGEGASGGQLAEQGETQHTHTELRDFFSKPRSPGAAGWSSLAQPVTRRHSRPREPSAASETRTISCSPTLFFVYCFFCSWLFLVVCVPKQ